jgi:P27 family predicted phage terminase small subunit
VPELERLNLLTMIDDATLEGACLNYARALQARSMVNKQGLTIITTNGFVLPHPAVAIERNSWAAWLRFASTFGLTPASRSSIHIKMAEGKSTDNDEDFLFGKTATGTRGKRGS